MQWPLSHRTPLLAGLPERWLKKWGIKSSPSEQVWQRCGRAGTASVARGQIKVFGEVFGTRVQWRL